jgi:hypothetical protein
VYICVNIKKARLGLYSIFESANGQCEYSVGGDNAYTKDVAHIYGEKSSSWMMKLWPLQSSPQISRPEVQRARRLVCPVPNWHLFARQLLDLEWRGGGACKTPWLMARGKRFLS